MFNIPPTLPPAQYIVQTEQTTQDALAEFAVQNNISFETTDIFEKQDKRECAIKLIAHRGYSAKAPENTIPAYIEAAKKGYKTVECDISWTKDNVPVLLHDKTINRTAAHKNGLPVIFPKNCSDLTYEELLNYDFGIKFGTKFKGTKIPTFKEFLKCCKENNLSPYIEIKENDSVDEEKIKMLVDMVEDVGLNDKTTWISFNSDYLKTISEYSPSSRLAFLSSQKPDEEILKILNSLKTDKNEVVLDAKASKLDSQSVDFIKQNGFDVEVWTVDNDKVLNKIFSYGCSAITTDNLTQSTVNEYYDIFTKED